MTNKSLYREEARTWSIYFATILVAVYAHEIGHCIPAWSHGFVAIPTPARQYSPDVLPASLQPFVSLGGIAGSALAVILGLLLFLNSAYAQRSAVLAGTLASPAGYVLRFILAGRGHDETEFQEAQSAIGFSFEGHAADWFFVVILVVGVAVWLIQVRPGPGILLRWGMGFLLTFLFLAALQKINNAIFDPMFGG